MQFQNFFVRNDLGLKCERRKKLSKLENSQIFGKKWQQVGNVQRPLVSY